MYDDEKAAERVVHAKEEESDFSTLVGSFSKLKRKGKRKIRRKGSDLLFKFNSPRKERERRERKKQGLNFRWGFFNEIETFET